MVAEKIYGFHLLKNAPMRMTREVNAKGTAAGMFVEDVPLYALDPGLALEAWLTGAKVDGDGPTIEFGMDRDGSFFAAWSNNKVRAELREPIVVCGNTLARTFCLAALRAAGHEVEDDKEGA